MDIVTAALIVWLALSPLVAAGLVLDIANALATRRQHRHREQWWQRVLAAPLPPEMPRPGRLDHAATNHQEMAHAQPH